MIRIDVQDDAGRAVGVSSAAAAVSTGGIIVLPTDTVYGVGADAFDPRAVAAVLAAKGRGRAMPPPVLVPSAETMQGLAMGLSAVAHDLMAAFWPGPLTLIYRSQPSLAWDLGDAGDTFAARMPLHRTALALLQQTGPLAVTSANRTGLPPATTVTEAMNQLGEAVAVYLDGGPSAGSMASTIVDVTGDAPHILRAGPITAAEIHDIAGTEVPVHAKNGAPAGE
ncbi:MAG: L-threonylcarbamoyladenylate synthase [Angustibacter sp.]